MRVLVACEFSGVVRDAFAARGHDAWSNDLLPSERPGNHIEGDCGEAIRSRPWDLIVMHPPCTALAVSGNRWYGEGMPRNAERRKAIAWTELLWEDACNYAPRVCMENPVGVLPMRPTQYIQPWQFGHGETKKTGLWLHGLPPLQPTNVVEGREPRVHRMPPSDTRWMERSRTYQGIADAMADQWGGGDRLTEVRARLAATQRIKYADPMDGVRADRRFNKSAQSDVAWLLEQVEDRDERIALLRTEVSDLEGLVGK